MVKPEVPCPEMMTPEEEWHEQEDPISNNYVLKKIQLLIKHKTKLKIP